ncbi:MAG: 2,3-bisphosphoglycerate-independent phosphoglycerate mutase [Erysipelotrichales bacterium]
MKKPVVLCIMDGVGIGEANDGNAYYLASTPTLDKLKKEYPCAKLKCSGMNVGLPDGQMGNSEVGHLNIGAGRIVYQSLTMINKKIEEHSFYENEEFLKAIKNAKENNKALHLMGLLSDGGVHSHINHLKALIDLASQYNLDKVYIHAFMDGRDTLRDSGIACLKDIISYCNEKQCGQIVSISGRYYAMDRDKRFERNFLAYQAMVLHQEDSFDNPIKYLEDSYAKEEYDEFVIPAYNSEVDGAIKDEDSVIFFNFRPDRAIQIASLLTNDEYIKVFDKQPKNLSFVCMMAYDKSVKGTIAFKHEKLENVLGVFLADNKFKQLRIAETEKYAHVTFFFDGQINYDGINNPELEGAKRILIDSPKVATYDLQPEMSADKVKDALIEELNKEYLDVVILNFANGDMVGHTGVKEAAIKAVEKVDECINEIHQVVNKQGGVMLISADHGNCEEMIDHDGNVLTAHTTNEVEIIVTDKDVELNDGKLSDIAPTIISYLGVDKPKEMSGSSLIK